MVNYPLILAPCSKIRGIIQNIAATLGGAERRSRVISKIMCYDFR